MTPPGSRTARVAIALLAAAVVGGCASRPAAAPPAAAASLPASGTPSPAAGPCGTTGSPPPTYAHVIWIWYENASLDTIIGNPQAPNINRLAAACGLARNYTGIDHPSATDYVAATSGAVHAGQGDCTPARCPDPDPSLFEQVTTWKTYNGGEVTLRQLFFRPAVRANPYTTSDPSLFICSSSTPPGGGAHGMCGFHAARTALRHRL